MDWHLRWTSDVRTLYHVNAYRWPWVKRMHTTRPGRQRDGRSGPVPAEAPGGVASTENRV
jgi:hypothetical protein